MEMEELLEKIKQNNTFTAEEFEEGLRFFNEASEFNTELVNSFFEFCLKVASSTDIYDRLEKVHRVTKKFYDRADVNYPLLWKLDFIEIYYAYFFDSLSQVLKHVNKILMNNQPDVDKCGAYSFAIMVFFRLRMFSKAFTYIDEADIYLKNHQTSPKNLFQILINELDIYSASKDPKKYIATLDRLKELMDNSSQFENFSMIEDFYTLHILYGKVALMEFFPINKNEMSLTFKELLSRLRKWKHIGENYGTLLMPLFAFFKDTFDEEEFIDEITHVLTYNMNVNEKLVLYKYLFETVGIDKQKYHTIYDDYIYNLSIYFTNTQMNKATEILTEILNFSLEKKLNVLNAKFHYDTLTGCYNRVFLSEIEERMLESGDVVVYLDLNDFKKINDTYGHDTGDRQLKLFAEILMRTFEGDVVLRLGGDEFVVLTRGLPEDVLAKLDQARAEYLTHNLLKNRYGFSAGVLIPHGMAVHEAIGEADKAMYESKKTGLPCIIREV